MLALGGAVALVPLGLGGRRFPRRQKALATLSGLAAVTIAALLLRQGTSGLQAQAWTGTMVRLLGVLTAGWAAAAAGLYITRYKVGTPYVAVLGGAALFLWIQPHGEQADETGRSGDAGPDTPDLILLTIDTWRADASGLAGEPLVDGLMPELEQHLAGARRYEQAVAPVPLTGPSHAAALSGRQPWELGLLRNGRPIPAGHPWLPAFLQEQGYTTAAFVSSAMVHGDLGFARGFDTYDDDLDGRTAWRRTLWAALRPPRPAGSSHRARWERPGEETLARLEVWLEQQGGAQPLFIWVHLYEPHSPYRPPDDATLGWELEPGRLPRAVAYLGHPSHGQRLERLPHTLEMLRKRHQNRSAGEPSPFDMTRETVEPPDEAWFDQNGAGIRDKARAYLGEVRHADTLAEELVEMLATQRGDRPRAWVVAGDHGESLTEHHEYASHQRHVYEANVRVPLLVLPPDGVAGGAAEAGPVSSTCVAGTLAALAGVGSEEFCVLPGPWTDGTPTTPADSVVRGPDHGSREGRTLKVAVREGPIKLVAGQAQGAPRTSGELTSISWREWYDLDADPHEIVRLPGEAIDGEVRQRLVDRAEALILRVEAARTEPGDVGAEVREALEALGYVE